MKKICITISLISALSLSVIGCGKNESTASELEKTAETAIESTTEEAAAKQGPIDVVLNSATTTEGDEWDELDEGKELLVLDVSITNHLESDYDFNPYYFTVQANRESISVSFARPKDEDTLNSYKVAPEETLNGIVCFDIDKGTTDYRIFYADFDGTEIELTLN